MGDKRRVLVLEDDRNYEQLLTAVVSGDDGPYQVECAHTMAEALASIYRRPPEVVLVDLNLPDSSGYSTFQRVRRTAKSACIIVLTGTDDDQLAIRAVQDGAADYLVKSAMQPTRLARSIRMAVERQHRQGTDPGGGAGAVIWGFLGSKGGVGASTVALNVAAALAADGARALFLDMQPGPGAITRYTSPPAGADVRQLLGKPAGTLTLDDLRPWFTEPVRGLRIFHLASSPEPWRPLGPAYVRALISLATGDASHVVLDLGSRVDDTTAEALRICHGVVLVVDREPASLWCACAVQRQIEPLLPETTGGLNLVLVDRSQPFGSVPAEEILKQLRTMPAATVSSAAGSLDASHLAGIPAALLDPQGAFARSVRQLIGRLPAAPVVPFVAELPACESKVSCHPRPRLPLQLESGSVA